MSFALTAGPKGSGINCISGLLGGGFVLIPSRNGDAHNQVMRHRASGIWR
jgi:hypothetical protein